MSAVPFVDLSVAPDDAEVRAAIESVLAAGSLILGPEVDAFEREFAEYCGSGHCVGVSSGTAALELILRGMGIGAGDEVIVPAYTAIATWMAVSEVGATPVAVDVDACYGIDPRAAAAARSPRTRAVIAVHLLGRPLDLNAVADALPDVPIIEDCAQAHGARIGPKRVGSSGIAGAFSFYPTKNLAALGDGGAVITDDAALADRIRLLRSFGWRTRSESLIRAGNARLDEIQAAVLRVRLRRLDAGNARRATIAAEYTARLTDVPGVHPPGGHAWEDSVWHLYVLRTSTPAVLQKFLRERAVAALRHYDPLPHQAQAFADMAGATPLPIAELLASESLSLPMGPHITSNDIDSVVDAITEWAAAGRPGGAGAS